jgi:hypothetical protein
MAIKFMGHLEEIFLDQDKKDGCVIFLDGFALEVFHSMKGSKG